MFKPIRLKPGRYPIVSFFVLATVLSWSIELALVASYNGLIGVPMWLHYLASFGPCLAAMAVAYATAGRQGLHDLWSRATRWRVGWKWLLLGALSPVGLATLAGAADGMVTGRWPDLGTLGQVEYLGNIGAGAALLLWLATFGFGEEIGWRGFTLPALQKRHSFLFSTLLIGLVWAAWHLPAFFYKPQLIDLGPGGFVGYSLGIVSGSILLGWLCNQAGGSVFIVAIWHALFDFFTTSPSFQGTVTAVMSTLVMVVAVLIVLGELRRPRSIAAAAVA